MINVWAQNVPFNDAHDVILMSGTDVSEMIDHDHDHDMSTFLLKMSTS